MASGELNLSSALSHTDLIRFSIDQLGQTIWGRENSLAWREKWRVWLAPLLRRTLSAIKAHTNSRQRRTLIWIFDRASMMGNLVREIWGYRELYSDLFDDLVIVGPALSYAANRRVMDIMLSSVTYVEVDDPAILSLAKCDVGILDFEDSFFLLTNEVFFPRKLFDERYARGVKPSPPMVGEFHRKLGAEVARSVGIGEDDRLVAVHVRESSGSQKQRDVAIRDYGPVFEKLIEEGYRVVRIGDRGMPALSFLFPFAKEIIDLPHHRAYDPILDWFVVSHSRFMILSDSGPGALAWAWGVPVLALNATYHYNRTPTAVEFNAYQRYFDRRRGRYLSHREIVEGGVYHLQRDAEFAAAGLELHGLPPDVLLAVTEEWLRRGGELTGPRQERFRRIAQIEHGRALSSAVGRERWQQSLRNWFSLGALPYFEVSEAYCDWFPGFLDSEPA
ncbi:TIGR04372 family glycosyltransferase [Endothiovibrio diazotrophicus]